MKKLKISKGTPGYIHSQKIKRSLITSVLFAIPLGIFFIGLIETKTRLNLFTFVAILGCLPAARSAVGMIMMLMQKPIDKEVCEKIKKKAGDLTMAYELVITAYEKNTPIEAIAVCGPHVVGYTTKADADCAYVEKHIREILKGNGYREDVKLFKDLKPFLDRIGGLAARRAEIEDGIEFTPNETYPDLSRSEVIKHTIMAISL